MNTGLDVFIISAVNPLKRGYSKMNGIVGQLPV